jgi:hypothetical protein
LFLLCFIAGNSATSEMIRSTHHDMGFVDFCRVSLPGMALTARWFASLTMTWGVRWVFCRVSLPGMALTARWFASLTMTGGVRWVLLCFTAGHSATSEMVRFSHHDTVFRWVVLPRFIAGHGANGEMVRFSHHDTVFRWVVLPRFVAGHGATSEMVRFSHHDMGFVDFCCVSLPGIALPVRWFASLTMTWGFVGFLPCFVAGHSTDGEMVHFAQGRL